MKSPDRFSGFAVIAVIGFYLVLLSGPSRARAVSEADVNTLIFQGSDFHYRGDIEKAVERFEKALRLDPDNEFAHNQLGLLYVKRGRKKEALSWWKKILRINPSNKAAKYYLKKYSFIEFK